MSESEWAFKNDAKKLNRVVVTTLQVLLKGPIQSLSFA